MCEVREKVLITGISQLISITIAKEEACTITSKKEIVKDLRSNIWLVRERSQLQVLKSIGSTVSYISLGASYPV